MLVQLAVLAVEDRPGKGVAALLGEVVPVFVEVEVAVPRLAPAQHRLNTLDASGEDVTDRLRAAVTQRELATAKDKGVTLAWRLKGPAAGAAGGKEDADAARRAAEGSRPPGQKPSKGSGAGRGAMPLDRQRANLADKQRSAGPERDSGPEAAAG